LKPQVEMASSLVAPVWVDTHAHLFLMDEEPERVLDRAADAGVAWLMCPGVDVETSEQSRDLASRFPERVLWSAGLHPHDASDWPEVRDRVATLASEASAVGECGLDWYRNLSSREDQILAFSQQLELASELDKPIIIHCRDAFRDVHDMLEAADLGEKAVLHCWTGGSKWTKRFERLGVTFSLAGPLTYQTGETLQLAARFLPRDRTMVETDSPYLTPEPMRGRPNEPANVTNTGLALAGIWGMDDVDVAALTSEAASRVFGPPHG
jgi:TatD DNase family protein